MRHLGNVIGKHPGTTDRLFSLGFNGGALDASGTGVMSFTNTGAIAMIGGIIGGYAR